MVSFFGLMGHNIKVILSTTIFTEMVNISEATGRNTKESGKITRCMDKGNFIGLMDDITKEVMHLIKKTDMGSLCGQVVRSIKDSERMECNMEREPMLILLVILEMGNGTTERN